MFSFGMIGTVFARIAGMKNPNLLILAVFVAALTGAAGAASMPESQLSTPVDEPSFVEKTVDSDNSSLDRKRAERRAARERILSKLRESSPREKDFVREELIKKGNENSRKGMEYPKNENSPRRFHEERFQGPEDRPMMEPDRGMPPPEFGEPKF
jgi:hypothetical protein